MYNLILKVPIHQLSSTMSKFYGQTDFMAKMTTPCFKGKKWVILAREITYARQSGSFKNFLGLFVRVTWGKESFNCWPGKYLTPSEARIDPWTAIESIKNIEFYFLLPLKVKVYSWFFQPKPKSRWNFSFLYCRYIKDRSESVEKTICHQASKTVIIKKIDFLF